MATCSICTETYNKLSRKPVACPVCDQSTCSSCCAKYILNGQQAPHCMHCKNMWTTDFLMTTFTKKFANGPLLDWMTSAAIAHERTLFPATQQLIDRKRKIEDVSRQIKKQRDAIKHMRAMLREAYQQKSDLEEKLEKLKFPRSSSPVAETNTYPCPNPDCRSYVATGSGACEVCGSLACDECHKAKAPDAHECNPDDVGTVRLLKEARPCPKCKMLIAKIDGCDQMWCMICHTPFSWTRGTIITGRFHNPHYTEWLRQTSQVMRREIGDVPCGGLPPMPLVDERINDVFGDVVPLELVLIVLKVWEDVEILETSVIPNLQRTINHDNHRARDMYLRGETDAAAFEVNIRRQVRIKLRAEAMLDVYSSAHQVMLELFRNIVGETSADFMQQHLSSVQTVANLFNQEVTRVAKTHNVTKPKLLTVL